MDVVKTIKEVRQKVSEARKTGKRVGFVPTMGYLHDGHVSLVRESSKHSDYQVMSIFVNRMQFNDAGDFENYPVDINHDSELARNAGVDLLFMPEEKEIYTDRKAYVDIETLADNLCGAFRPGHFRGALTIVAKLFNIVQPDVSVFGQKDIQQAISIDKMVKDLDFPLEIIIAPIIREESGLALSSRNKHLTVDEKKRALVLYYSLRRAEDMLKKGERGWKTIHEEMEAMIKSGSPTMIDYISLVRRDDLQISDFVVESSVIAVAAFFGTTRLIDNMLIDIQGDSVTCSI